MASKSVAANKILPLADAGPDQNVDDFETVTLDGSRSTDPKIGHGNNLAHLWVQTAPTPSNPIVTLSDDTAVQPTFDAPDAGLTGDALTFTLTVTDEDELVSTDEVDVVVAKIAPQANAGQNQTVNESVTVTLEALARPHPARTARAASCLAVLALLAAPLAATALSVPSECMTTESRASGLRLDPRPPADLPLDHWAYPHLTRLVARGILELDLTTLPVSRAAVAAASGCGGVMMTTFSFSSTRYFRAASRISSGVTLRISAR